MAAIRWAAGMAALLLALSGAPAQAQWSIGAPGPAQASAGRDKYVFLVFANPIPGREAQFNDWYQNVHLGDLVQLEGWDGAQRFRLEVDVQPRPTAAGYQRGYLIVWDQQGAGKPPPRSLIGDANRGGKARRGEVLDFTPGAIFQPTYHVLGPRIRRPDGQRAFMPAAGDNKTPRPDRYVMLEFTDPAPGEGDAAFEAAIDRRIQAVLGLPGWMAAQRLRFEPVEGGPPNAPPTVSPRFLTVWEIEGPAQAANAALNEAVKSGKVAALKADPRTAVSTYWRPISPYVTKDDINR
jgi:hypothetical protein